MREDHGTVLAVTGSLASETGTVVLLPEFTLTFQSHAHPASSGMHAGSWRFVLRTADGSLTLEVEEPEEPCDSADRLALLALVRGLEALDQPSQVLLVTENDYVYRGLCRGRGQGPQGRWDAACLERDAEGGNNRDLWDRVAGALNFHQVFCRQRQGGRGNRLLKAQVPGRPAANAWWTRWLPRIGGICANGNRANGNRANGNRAKRNPCGGGGVAAGRGDGSGAANGTGSARRRREKLEAG